MMNMLITAVKIQELPGTNPSAFREHQVVGCALTHFDITSKYLEAA
jgi:hypothetical protein